MKIIQVFPGKVWGGAEQYVLDLGTALESRGHEVVYVCRNAGAVTSRLEGVKSYVPLDFGGWFDRRTAAELSRLTADADIVHVHDAKFLLPVLRALKKNDGTRHVKVVLTRHIARDSRVLPWNRWLYRQLNSMIFVSELGRKLWFGVNGWMDESRCRVVRNSIPPALTMASEDNVRSKFGIADDTPLLMFTGRVRKSKGCAIIIEALGQLKDLPWAMVFVGTCKPVGYDEVLMKMAAEHGIADRVHFYGFSRNVRALLHEADIGIAPSIVREACPLSPMEFMQAGKPVVTTGNGAQPEFISDAVGVLVRPADAGQLSAALRGLIVDKALRESKGEAAKRFFDTKMNYETFVDNVESAY